MSGQSDEQIVNEAFAYLLQRFAEAGGRPDEAGRRRVVHMLALLTMRAAEDVGDDGPTFLRQTADAHMLTLRAMLGSEGDA